MNSLRFQGRICFILFSAFLLFGSFGEIFAEALSVTASIVPSTTVQVRQPVQLQIMVKGGDPENLPANLDVPGLQFLGMSRNFSFTMQNMNFSRSQIYVYTFYATRPGEYTIPSFEIRIGNKNVKTAPIRLQAIAAGSQRGLPAQTIPGNIPAPPPPAQMMMPGSLPVRPAQNSNHADAAFAELKLSKKECYVGETVPAEIRFYVDARLRCRFNGPPVFSGEGFSTPRLQRPEESTEEVNGTTYVTATFSTAVTPVKTGTLEIPSAKFDCIVQDASASNGMDDFFAQFFGQGGGGMGMGGAREATIQTDPTALKVKPLPAEGKPEEFNGAIGDFALSAEAAPKKVAIGEPVTLKLVVTGQGNFDAFTAPVLTNLDGWKTYTPKEHFAPANAIGTTGRKTFEYLLIAQDKKDTTPGAEFSYFDPAKQKYVTLHASPIPVQIEGPAAQPSPAATLPAGIANASATPSAASPAPSSSVALPIETRVASAPDSFASPVRDWRFLAAQAVALSIVIVCIGLAIMKRMNSGEAARRRELHRQADRKLDLLESQITDRKQFYQGAISYLQEETASRTDKAAADVTIDDVIRVHALDDTVIAEIREIFIRNDELSYGATGRISGDIESRERDQVVKSLRKLNHANAS